MADAKISGLTAGTPIAGDNFVIERGGIVNYKVAESVLENTVGTSLAAGTVLMSYVAPGTSGNVLTSNGTAWESAAPASGDGTKTFRGTISNPQAVYAQAASLPIMKADAALTITGIYIDTRQTAEEMAGDLKFADDQTIGSLANATVIDVCDTTSGVFSATSGFDDATVPSGKYIYYQFDASPNAAIKDFTLRITYTYD